MRVVVGVLVTALLTLIPTSVSADSPYNDYTNDIAIPNTVSLNVQNIWQGYIIYSIKLVNGTYACLLARDSEPHQYPTRTITLDTDWVIISDTGYQSPEPKPEPKPKTESKVEPTPPPTPAPVVTPEPVTPKPVEEKPKREKPQKPDKPQKPEITAPLPEEPQKPETPDKPQKPDTTEEPVAVPKPEEPVETPQQETTQ